MHKFLPTLGECIMLRIGQYNLLKVVKEVSFGLYLDGGSYGEILLPKQSVSPGTKIGDSLNVFIYFDSSDKIIATTTRPYAQVHTCAYLKVIDVNRVGAFLDWGLNKDLLVPEPEQYQPMQVGQSYLVYLKLDPQGRIIGSSKIDHFLDQTPIKFKQGDEVKLLVANKTPLGTKVIINHRYWGLIHTSDLFQTLSYGQKVLGYIKSIRPDGKVDVALRKVGPGQVVDLAQRILQTLKEHQGFLPLHDKSPTEDIQRAFGESKKNFKRAIGQLYQQKKIRIELDGIYACVKM
jgi:predicted RNA-binding protein (virulence factor B family)